MAAGRLLGEQAVVGAGGTCHTAPSDVHIRRLVPVLKRGTFLAPCCASLATSTKPNVPDTIYNLLKYFLLL